MIHWNMQQRTDEWREYRLGKISCSMLGDIMPIKSGYSTKREKYMLELASQILTGKETEKFQSADMLRGIELEQPARTEFEFRTGIILHEAGFIDHPTIEGFGGSPDGLIGNPKCTGGGEIKCLNGVNHINEIESLEGGRGPISNYGYQIHGLMLCAGVSEWHYILYNPDISFRNLQYYSCVIKRDERICSKITAEVIKFKEELKAYIERLSRLDEKIGGRK